MVLAASAALVPSKFQVTSTKSHVCQLCNAFPINVHKQRVSVTCSAKFSLMEHFNDPTKRKAFWNYTKDNRKAFWNYTKDNIWKVIPDSVKDFPWKKAEIVALHKLLVLEKETVKWPLLACYAFGCLSDILYSISRNKELVISFGLFVGCLLTKYFDEIAQELVHEHKDNRHVTWRFFGISCFFVILKLFTYLLGGNDFFLHAANGGLMQVLWNWKNSRKHDVENTLSDDVPIAMDADN